MIQLQEQLEDAEAAVTNQTQPSISSSQPQIQSVTNVAQPATRDSSASPRDDVTAANEIQCPLDDNVRPSVLDPMSKHICGGHRIESYHQLHSEDCLDSRSEITPILRTGNKFTFCCQLPAC